MLLEHLEARVAGDVYDADAWGALLSETAQREPSVFRPVFERCVATYPSSPGVWRQWIDAELRNGQLQPAEELFGRCLLTVPYLELWQLYLVYLGQKGAPAQEMQQVSILNYQNLLKRLLMQLLKLQKLGQLLLTFMLEIR